MLSDRPDLTGRAVAESWPAGIRSGDQNLLVLSHKYSDSSIDPSAVVYQQPPSARMLQPLTTADLSQPPAQVQVSRLRAAYQGYPGSNSELATSRAYPNGEAISCDLFETVFLPRHWSNVSAVSPSTPGAVLEAVDDSARAAEFIAMNKFHDVAAIASSRAAEIFGLQVLADSIEDDGSNVTRYVKLHMSRSSQPPTGHSKTSIVISHDQGADILFEMLLVLESRGIRLMKIMTRLQLSRPIRIAGEVMKEMFQCVSYVELAASMAEKRMLDTLVEVGKFSSFVRALGSYPTEETSLRG